MKKYCHSLLTFLVLLLFLSACHPLTTSNKVEQRVIFPSYSIHYDEAGQTLTAIATFQKDNESGEYIKLSNDSYVFFNQDAMNQMSDKERPCYYLVEKNEVTSCPETGQFNYANDKGLVFSNKLNIYTIQISDISLSKNQDNIINYKGTAISEDETVSLVLSKDHVQYDIQPEILENSQLLFTSAMLRELKPGTYDACIQRTSYSTSVKAMDRGGNAETSFYSKIYKITIQ